MAKKKTLQIFLDTDVILDLLAQREPHVQSVLHIFLSIQQHELKAATSSVVIANLFYILRKSYSRSQTKRHIHKLLMFVDVLSVGEDIIMQALNSEFTDFEDAIQYYTAMKYEIDVLVTRNKKDYVHAQIQVLLPAEFTQLYQRDAEGRYVSVIRK